MNVLNKINNRSINEVKDKASYNKRIMKNYYNLRRNYKDLIETILGENYYNLANDVQTCDNIVADDIKRKFQYLNNDLKVYKRLFIASLFIIAGLLYMYIR